MKQVEDKLDTIADIWNDFIWEHKFCSSKIKFNDDKKTNYFGDILRTLAGARVSRVPYGID